MAVPEDLIRPQGRLQDLLHLILLELPHDELQLLRDRQLDQLLVLRQQNRLPAPRQQNLQLPLLNLSPPINRRIRLEVVSSRMLPRALLLELEVL